MRLLPAALLRIATATGGRIATTALRRIATTTLRRIAAARRRIATTTLGRIAAALRRMWLAYINWRLEQFAIARMRAKSKRCYRLSPRSGRNFPS